MAPPVVEVAQLGWEAWVTLGIIVVTVVALVREIAPPDLIFAGTLGLILVTGVIPPEEALSGFANPAVLILAALFVVAAGVQRTQALAFMDGVLFGRRPSVWTLPRLMLPVAGLSAFLNNTPIVAMLIPRVQTWAARHDVAPSRLLIPLSYAAILGGTMTLIGTSTNIVVAGLMQAEGVEPLGLFDLTWVGLPVGLVAIAYLAFIGYRLLPDRKAEGPDFEDGLKDCIFELKVAADSPMVGATIEDAGLRALGKAFLIHVRRDDRIIPAKPGEVLLAGDELAFTGTASMIDDLLRRPGLERVLDSVSSDDSKLLPLFEAVVAANSSLVGKTLREADFREKYGGVVLGLQRRDRQAFGPLGRIPLKAGDLLLIEAPTQFADFWNADRQEFYLVAARREQEAKPTKRKAPIALLLVGGMVAAAASGLVPLVTAALAAALAMILTRCLRGREARRAVDLQVLVVVAIALGIGRAVQLTGLADVVAQGLVVAAEGLPPVLLLVALYVATNVLTELITNNAAAVLMLPVALAVAATVGLEPKAVAITVAVAASASFMTPIGYQTNLMVMSAGRYRFVDYFKVGLPVSLLVMVLALTVIAVRWL